MIHDATNICVNYNAVKWFSHWSPDMLHSFDTEHFTFQANTTKALDKCNLTKGWWQGPENEETATTTPCPPCQICEEMTSGQEDSSSPEISATTKVSTPEVATTTTTTTEAVTTTTTIEPVTTTTTPCPQCPICEETSCQETQNTGECVAGNLNILKVFYQTYVGKEF